MRKKGTVLLLGFVVIVAGGWITSCGPSVQPEEGVIDVWATWGEKSDHLQSLLDRYVETGGEPVRVVTRIRSDDLLEGLTSGEPPDLVLLSSADLVRFYEEQGLVERLEPWLEASGLDLEDFYPAPLELCKHADGGTLCLPWGCDLEVLFWNKDLFAAAGLDPDRPPQTMEEVLEYASRLTVIDEQGELTQVGFIPDFSQSHTELFARMFGGGFYTENGTVLALNSQPVIDALSWQMKFEDAYKPADLDRFVSSQDRYRTSSHPLYAGRRRDCQQCHRSSHPRSDRAPEVGFYEGRIAMMLSGEWQIRFDVPSRDDLELSYGIAPFPPPAAYPGRANTSVIHGPVLMLPSEAQDKEAAAKLLAWMMSPEIAAEAAYTSSMLPTTRRAALDPRFQADPAMPQFLDLLAHPNAKAAATAAVGQPIHEALRRAEAELLYGEGDPRSVLNRLQSELALMLEEAVAQGNAP